jgi:antirestriction protein ArdC
MFGNDQFRRRRMQLHGSAPNRAVVRAASAASKAADFLLAFLPPAIESVVEDNEEAA